MDGLLAYLSRGRRLADEQAVWPLGTRLSITAYLHDELPRLDIVTSVRCLLRRGDELLVFTDSDGTQHVLPGGRREPGEALEQTLRREVLEETGWMIGPPRLLGCIHLRHLTPKPPGYPYIYPDFLQVVYLAEALSYHPDRMAEDEYVTGTRFMPLAALPALPVGPVERAYLSVALDLWTVEGTCAGAGGEDADVE